MLAILLVILLGASVCVNIYVCFVHRNHIHSLRERLNGWSKIISQVRVDSDKLRNDIKELRATKLSIMGK